MIIFIVGEAMKKSIRHMDMPLLIATIILAVFGLVMIFSASSVTAIQRYDYKTYHFFTRQLIFIVFMTFIGFGFIIRFPTKKYNPLVALLLLGTIISLIYLIGYRQINNVDVRSIDLKIFKLQPSELAKLTMIGFSALFYNFLYKTKNIKKKFYLVPLILTAMFSGLIFLAKDLGSAMILFLIGTMIFLSIPFKHPKEKQVKRNTIVTLIIFVLLGAIGAKTLLSERQWNRFTYKAPCTRYKESTGYQVCNGFIAIKNGGLFGVGFGESKQKSLYLPESHTDFIFPIIVEEAGLIVGIIVILLYLFVLFRLYKISVNTYNLRNSILAYGTFSIFFLHISINLLGVLGVIPLTGVPLPLLSYGGSSTIVFMTLLFITQRVSIENKQQKLQLEIKSL